MSLWHCHDACSVIRPFFSFFLFFLQIWSDSVIHKFFHSLPWPYFLVSCLPWSKVHQMDRKMDSVLKILMEQFPPQPQLMSQPSFRRVTIQERRSTSIDNGLWLPVGMGLKTFKVLKIQYWLLAAAMRTTQWSWKEKHWINSYFTFFFFS